MDLDPFEPVGIRADTMRVLDVFLLHCLLSDSPPDCPEELVRLGDNQHLSAARGREPGLRLCSAEGGVPLRDWAARLLAECRPLAAAMASAHDDERYVDALEAARSALGRPESLPSARVLQAMAADPSRSYIGFVRGRSRAARSHLLSLPYGEALHARMQREARESIAAQERIEAGDTMPFEAYRQQYLAPERLGV